MTLTYMLLVYCYSDYSVIQSLRGSGLIPFAAKALPFLQVRAYLSMRLLIWKRMKFSKLQRLKMVFSS